MRYTADEPLTFKFQFTNPQGQPTSMFSKSGRFDGAVLTLDKQPYAAETLLEIAQRENRMAITALTSPTEATSMLLSFGSKKVATRVKEALDIVRSRHWAEKHRQELTTRGRGGAYRDAECGQCGAAIVLSDMPVTPQVFCPYCDTLATVDGNGDAPPNEAEFRVCDSCHLFSKPQKFTVMYVWFLLVVYGWWTQEKWCCRGCMRGEAWKMVFGNLPFVIGFPFALVQLVRSYSGSLVGGAFRELDTGNVRAKRGDVAGALTHYRAILERVPHSAGVKFNLGQGLLKQGEFAHAAKSFEAALADCANYAPAYGQLRQLYAHLGETQKLKTLNAQWDDAERQAEDADDEDAESIAEAPQMT
jgi:hypothetical protein